MSDLFSDAAQERAAEIAPLAARLRPERLEDFVGQAKVVGEAPRSRGRSPRTA